MPLQLSLQIFMNVYMMSQVDRWQGYGAVR